LGVDEIVIGAGGAALTGMQWQIEVAVVEQPTAI
jgi:hypothetical protein